MNATAPDPKLHEPVPPDRGEPAEKRACRNLSTSSGNTGQDAAPADPARLTVEFLIELLDMLRRLDERAKADVRASTHPTRADADADPAPDRAGGAGNHRSLGGAPGDRQAFSQETVSET
jgi:hypothetical protein